MSNEPRGKIYRRGAIGKIRTHLQEMEGVTFRPFALSRVLKEPSQAVRNALRDMKRRGEVARVGPGQYRYLGSGMLRAQQISPARLRLFRAIHASVRFSAREIAVLSDSRPNFVQKMLRELVAQGQIELRGWQTGPRGGKETVFRVKDRDRFYLEWVTGKNEIHQRRQ
jgi:hypothetical protein